MLTANEQRCEGLTLDACHNAIRDAFAGTCGRMDIRWLWSRGDTHRFRVNWWRLSPSGADPTCSKTRDSGRDKLTLS